MSSTAPELSICIVTFQNRDCIGECLRSVRAAKGLSFETIVVDNGSNDGTAELVRNEFPEAHLITKPRNMGFAAANNDALRTARGEFLLLLNPDTIVPPDALATLLRFARERPDAGVVGCRLVNVDGSLQRSVRRFPTFAAAMHQFTIARYLGCFRKGYDAYRARDFDYANPGPCDSVMGAAFLIRREVLQKVGLLDERYFMYYEEVDFCRRVWDGGWKVYFCPDAMITHLGGQSAHQARRLAHVERLRSLMRYFARHRGRWATFWFKLIFLPLAIARAVVEATANLLRTPMYRFARCDPYRASRSWANFKSSLAFLAWDWLRVAVA